MKDDLIGTRSDVRVSIADHWLLSMSVVVSDGTKLEAEANAKK